MESPPSGPAVQAAQAAASMYGTDAHLAPSTPDAVLRYAAHPRGFAELRVPRGAGPFPLAVIFHGGCWKTGIATQAYMAPLATRWQQLGVATLNVDYREVGDGGGWPGSFEDWAAAEELVRGLAQDRRFDLSRLTYVGHSAGALPAQWLAALQGDDGPVGRRPLPLVADAIVFDGPADLRRDQAPFDALCQFAAVSPFIGGAPDEASARYDAISPLRHSSRLGKLRFVQAKLPAPHPDALAALRDAGVDVQVTLKPDATHFDVITPGAAAYQAVEPQLLEVLRR
ncbi:MAG: alpha/beta hydrolase family protein [Cypionkella sp.]